MTRANMIEKLLCPIICPIIISASSICRTAGIWWRMLALAVPGVVLNKDGSFQRTARFRGPDLDSAVAAELVAVAGRLNGAFRRLGSGWAVLWSRSAARTQATQRNCFPIRPLRWSMPSGS